MKIKTVLISISLLLTFISILPSTSCGDTLGETFSIVSIPDTQEMADRFPVPFNQMTDWIVDNTDAYNIKFVVHLGDMVDDGDNDVNEWTTAREAMDRLFDNSTPVLGTVGNHDYDDEFGGHPKDTDWWNNYFPLSLWSNNINNASHCQFGGSYPDTTSNNMYAYFNASGEQFMVIGMSFCENDSEMQWLNDTLNGNRDKHVIMFAHSHINHDDTYFGETLGCGETVCYVCQNYTGATGGGETVNDGDDVYNEVLSYHDNIALVLSGHQTCTSCVDWDDNGMVNETTNASYQTGLFDPSCYQFLHNYQQYTNGGDGTINIWTFNLSANTINVTTYTVGSDTWRTAGYNQYEFSFQTVHNAQFNNINSLNNTEETTSRHRTFNWTRDIGATIYQLQVSNTSDFSTTFINLTNITEGGYLESLPGCTYDEKGLYVEFSLPYAHNITFSGKHYYRLRSYKP